ncbi:MAG: DUF748 domain-containing protein [Gammaproteobacteria bacterium]
MSLEKKSGKLPRRLLGAFCTLLALYVLIGFFVIPSIAKREAVAFLDQRLGGHTQIQAIALNPFTFGLSITGAAVHDPDDKALLSFDSVFVNFEPTSYLSGAIEFSEISIDGFNVNFQRYPDGDTNIARVAQRWAESAAPVETPETPAPDSELPLLRVASLRVNGASVGIVDDVASPAFKTLVESIDFALDDLSTVPNSAAQQQLTLAIGEGSQLRWLGELTLAPLSSKGELQLFGPLPQLAYRYLQEQIPVALRGGWFDASLAYEFSLTDAGEADVKVQALTAALTNLDVHDKLSDALLLRLPVVSVHGGTLDLLQRQVSLERILLDRVRVDVERTKGGVLNLQQAFSSAPQETAAATPEQTDPSSEPAWRVQLSELALEDWDLRVRDLQPEQALIVSLDFNAHAANITNADNESAQLSTDLTLSSGGTLQIQGDVQLLPEFGFGGALAIESLALPVIQPYLASVAKVQLESGTLSIDGNVAASSAQSEFNGNASLETLVIRDTLENEELFGLAALRFSDSVFSVGDETRIDIGGIDVQAPYARVEIEEDGSNNISRVLITPAQTEESLAVEVEAAEQVTATELPAIRVEQINLSEGRADFSDHSLPLPFAVYIEGLGGDISALSTRTTEPARINLEGQVDEFGLASITGRIRPLDYAQLTEIDLSFLNLNIPSLSPYVVKFAGRRIDSGALDVDLSYRINAGQLNGENAMVMRDLELGERIVHPDAMDLPLGLAIALLKDRNGVIDLDVPVSGDLESPQFNYGNVIRTALGNIIRNIVASPFSFLANLVGGDSESDIGVIEFVPGRADLQPPEREKLAQLAEALLQRPQLELGLLGRYSEVADSAVLREAFFDSRFELALESLQQAPSELTPALLRIQLLEQFYIAQAAPGVDAEADRLAVRQSFVSVDAQGNEQLDDLAYRQALRRTLIEQEAVTQDALEQLALDRVSAIVEALQGLDASLVDRVQTLAGQGEVALSDDRVPFALELSAAAR